MDLYLPPTLPTGRSRAHCYLCVRPSRNPPRRSISSPSRAPARSAAARARLGRCRRTQVHRRNQLLQSRCRGPARPLGWRPGELFRRPGPAFELPSPISRPRRWSTPQPPCGAPFPPPASPSPTSARSMKTSTARTSTVNSSGQITAPSDVTPAATNYPLAVIYDADGSVINAIFGDYGEPARRLPEQRRLRLDRQLQPRRHHRPRSHRPQRPLRHELRHAPDDEL